MTSRKWKYEFNENLSSELPLFKKVNYESKTCTKCIHYDQQWDPQWNHWPLENEELPIFWKTPESTSKVNSSLKKIGIEYKSWAGAASEGVFVQPLLNHAFWCGSNDIFLF